MEWDVAPGAFHGSAREVQETRAAGNLHDQNRHRLYSCLSNEGREFVQIRFLAMIQFWTCDGQGPASQVILVKTSDGESHTVCGQKQI